MSTPDWNNLSFSYYPVNSYVRATWRDGAWTKAELVAGDRISLPVGCSALHYGQTAFEGLKALAGTDGGVRIFRPQANAARLASSARRLCMAEVPESLFLDACRMAVRENIEFVPPVSSGGFLYMRPLLFGSSPMLAVAPASEYEFLLMVSPVGAYYRGGLKPVDAVVVGGYDRAAPLGTGTVKSGGNYAGSLLPGQVAKQMGFAINLYLDAKEHRFVDEFGTSNFIGIRGDTYITPASSSILPSITNDTLQQIAKDLGMRVERRPLPIEELATLDAAAAVGTAVVLTPVRSVTLAGRRIAMGTEGVHPRLQALYDALLGIQTGRLPDTHGWCMRA